MQETGSVIEIKNDKAKIKFNRYSACSKCKQDCVLGRENNHEEEYFFAEVQNEKSAQVGDIVKVELKDSSLVIGSIIIYIIPLLFFVGGYFIGAKLSFIFTGLSSEIFGILSSFICLYLSYLLTKRINKKIENSDRFRSKIVSIIKKNEGFKGKCY